MNDSTRIAAESQVVTGTRYIDMNSETWDAVHNVTDVDEGSQPVEYVELCFMRGDTYLSTILVDPTTGRTVRSWDYAGPNPRGRALRDEEAIESL